jgi:hypothetical protein
MYSSKRTSSAGLLLIFLSCVLQESCHGFVIPKNGLAFVATSSTTRDSTALGALPFDMPTSLLVTVDEAVDNIDAAFSDSINAMDGPIKIMIGTFGIVILVLVALKALAGQMDNAINQVLLEFETTLKRFHPQRWKTIEEQLEGLEGDPRDVKLLTMMEELQDTEPKFMAKVEEQMKTSRSTSS